MVDNYLALYFPTLSFWSDFRSISVDCYFCFYLPTSSSFFIFPLSFLWITFNNALLMGSMTVQQYSSTGLLSARQTLIILFSKTLMFYQPMAWSQLLSLVIGTQSSQSLIRLCGSIIYFIYFLIVVVLVCRYVFSVSLIKIPKMGLFFTVSIVVCSMCPGM